MKSWLIYIVFVAFFLCSLPLIWLDQQKIAAANSIEQISSCGSGMEGDYSCRNVRLLAHMPLSQIGAGETTKGNDHWGWTDPTTGHDYVIFGLTDGTAYIDITDRQNPVYLGKLPTYEGISAWWDIKVYQQYAFIGGDIPSNNGLQIFDLTQLRDVANPPVVFTTTAHYDGFATSHNLWINEATGYLYALRTDTCPTVHIFDLSNPTTPVPDGPNDDGVAGCFVDEPADKLVSDATCLIYQGPDTDYTGREICFIGSDQTLSIADVTDKAAPTIITNTLAYNEYPVSRLHQGALTEDQRYLLFSDVWDERDYGYNTRTYIWDMLDLDVPLYLGFYEAQTRAQDHNIYIVGDYAYQANRNAGLRIVDISSLPDTNFDEVGYFDIVPNSDSPTGDGAWSNYPWWGDGVVTVSGKDEGLFILQFDLPQLFLPLIMSSE